MAMERFLVLKRVGLVILKPKLRAVDQLQRMKYLYERSSMTGKVRHAMSTSVFCPFSPLCGPSSENTTRRYMSKAMWNLHLEFWAHQKCIGAGIIDIWISFDLWSRMAEEQNLHREQKGLINWTQCIIHRVMDRESLWKSYQYPSTQRHTSTCIPETLWC